MRPYGDGTTVGRATHGIETRGGANTTQRVPPQGCFKDRDPPQGDDGDNFYIIEEVRTTWTTLSMNGPNHLGLHEWPGSPRIA